MKSSVQSIACLFLCVFLQIGLHAQLYLNTIDNLPLSGASGQSVDVQTIDIDFDGDDDIILANEYEPNVILFNDGMGNFFKANSSTIPQVIHDSEDIAIADFNLDGFLDLIFVSEDDFEHEYYWNTGNNSFSTAQFLPFTACNAVAADDLNGDNIADLFLGNRGQNMIMINSGTGDLLNETPTRLPNNFDLTHDVKLADVNSDGALDIYVGNENNDVLLMNDGQGYFADESLARLPNTPNTDTRKVVFHDVDQDGDLDAFLCTVEFAIGKDPQNRLYINDGNGFFQDRTASHLPAIKDQSMDAIFIDLEKDGDPDLVIAGVLSQPIKFYLNDGTGRFTNETFRVMGSNNFIVDSLDALGLIHCDFNKDGFEDIYICNRAGKDVFFLRDPEGELYTVPTSTKEPELNKAIEVFPNPSQGRLMIELKGIDSHDIREIRLEDIQGRTLSPPSWQIAGETRIEAYVPPALISPGIYLLRIYTNDGLYSHKVSFN